MMVIRAFNKQEDEAERFDKANRDLTDTSLFVARVMVTMMPVMMLLMNGLSLGSSGWERIRLPKRICRSAI